MYTLEEFEEFAKGYDLYFYYCNGRVIVDFNNGTTLDLNFDLQMFKCKCEGIVMSTTNNLDNLLEYIDFEF